RIWKEPSATVPVGVERSFITEADEQSWSMLWHAMRGFDTRVARFILVAEAFSERFPTPLEALGRLPWSAIIDLDPNSDVTGLLSKARENLERQRGLHIIRGTAPDIEFDRGTAWLLAAGNEERHLLDYRDWFIQKPGLIRSVIDDLDVSSNPLP